MAILALPTPTVAQGNPGVAISNEFEAKASERARRKPSPLSLPNFQESATPASGAPLFKLSHVVLKGARSIPQQDLATAYRPYLGRPVSQKDLAKVAEAITAIYKARGFALSRAFVPPQDVERGRVEIQIAEGYVAEVALEGLDGDWTLARKLLDRLTWEQPARMATLERQLLLLSDIPGVMIKDVALKELGTGSGRFRLSVTAQFSRAIASVDLDNRGSRQVGPWQSFNTVALSSVLRQGDTLVVNGATVANDPRQLGYIGTIYETPLGSNGARLGLRQTFSEGWPAGIQRTIDVRTRTQEYALYASFWPLRARETSLKLTGAAGVREVEEVSSLGQHFEDHVSALSATIDLQHRDRFGGANFVSFAGRQGIAAFGASGAQDLTTSRFGAASDFAKISAMVVRYQALSGPFSLMFATAGQVTTGPVVRSEAFAFGGSFVGRAFAPSAFIGDNGLAGLAELRFDQGVDAGAVKGYQLYAFADRGVLWTHHGEVQTAASWGGGARMFLNHDMRLGFEVATVADAPAFAERETRFYVSLGRTFKGCATLVCD